MRIDLFAVWFMSGLMSRQLDQTAVFKVSSPAGALPPSSPLVSLPSFAPDSTMPLPASRRLASHMDDVSTAILL